MSGPRMGLLGPLAAFALRYPKTTAAAVNSASAVSNATTAVATALTGATKAAANATPVTFVLAHWKFFLGLLLTIIACVSAFIYIEHLKHTSFAAGVTSGGAQAAAAVAHANKIATEDQHQLDLLKLKYDNLSQARQTQVVTITKPIIERVTREVQSDPVYNSCALTDGVFNDLQAETAGIDASINSSQR